MIIAFTGTQIGMTHAQALEVAKLLIELEPEWVLHGDCIGADASFHRIVVKLRGESPYPKIHLYPSYIHHKRAYCDDYDLIEPEYEPLVRNKIMAKACDKLIACPKEGEEILRSGTWATVRYARKEGKVIYTILPNGKLI